MKKRQYTFNCDYCKKTKEVKDLAQGNKNILYLCNKCYEYFKKSDEYICNCDCGFITTTGIKTEAIITKKGLLKCPKCKRIIKEDF